jgi:8-amino-7-oxononanoate synthase
MIDFTSALYLGFRHPSRELPPWSALTTGAPAVLDTLAGAGSTARELAELVGSERGSLGSSTLHLFWDLFTILARERITIFMDGGIYPIARWGIERAAARGVRIRVFPHQDAEALRRHMSQNVHHGERPLVVVDGYSPASGRAAPIRDYLKCVRAYGGLLILDDTQALGILGEDPSPAAPYGSGGGGTARWSGVSGPDIVLASSLAKGFGAPMAVLTGSDAVVSRFEAASETRAHCSPPSAAGIHAARHALAVNRAHGDAMRKRLAQLILHFRNSLMGIGIDMEGGLFPVQTLCAGHVAQALHRDLLRKGVQTVLHHGNHGNGARISFLITIRHTLDELNHTVEALAALTRGLAFSGKGMEAYHEVHI